MKRASTSDRLPVGLPTRIVIGLVGNWSAESAGTVMTTVASKTVTLASRRSTLRTNSEFEERWSRLILLGLMNEIASFLKPLQIPMAPPIAA